MPEIKKLYEYVSGKVGEYEWDEKAQKNFDKIFNILLKKDGDGEEFDYNILRAFEFAGYKIQNCTGPLVDTTFAVCEVVTPTGEVYLMHYNYFHDIVGVWKNFSTYINDMQTYLPDDVVVRLSEMAPESEEELWRDFEIAIEEEMSAWGTPSEEEEAIWQLAREAVEIAWERGVI